MPAEPLKPNAMNLPFLKWPGGKRWFVSKHLDFFPKSFGTYIEAFAGSASVFFALQPERAILCDKNEELIATYRAIKSRVNKVKDALEHHARNHSSDYYYEVRASNPSDIVSRAARLIYLNRTCFNGIYRVNMNGQFNVPKGTKDSVLLATDNFSVVSAALRNAKLVTGDFALAIAEATSDDLVFADPPYTVKHNHNGFVKYNETIFSWDDQVRLADTLYAAMMRGAHIVGTNANHPSVRSLYAERGFELTTVSRFSAISGSGNSRGQYEELVVRSPNSQR